MIQTKEIIYLFVLLISLNSCNSNNAVLFNEIYNLTEQNNYFKARKLYESDKKNLSNSYRNFVEAVLANAFNQLNTSDNLINDLIKKRNNLPDSLKFKIYEVRYDNSIKLYKYKEAKNTIQIILNEYKNYLNKETTADYENNLKLWSALENTPKQRLDIKETTYIKMKKDIANLNTLKVFSNEDTLDFIFDTGANLSTTSQTVAQQLKMKIIPVDIKVGTITGSKVLAQLAVCSKLSMGNIDLYNVVFLVLPDEALSFPQINYQIYGIFGFPIIEAFKEIKITQDGNFIVSSEETNFSDLPNMAMNGLNPLIYINNKHFTFDTGADITMFYHRFYIENKEMIDQQYQPIKISFGGAGGKSELNGFKINYTFKIEDKEVNLNGISLLKDKIKDDETVYGNIGQDFIQQFESMTLNFNNMHVKFE